MKEAYCNEHFYVRESIKDLRKDQIKIKKDIFQMKLVLLIILINTMGFGTLGGVLL